jgi:hypothetical protein
MGGGVAEQRAGKRKGGKGGRDWVTKVWGDRRRWCVGTARYISDSSNYRTHRNSIPVLCACISMLVYEAALNIFTGGGEGVHNLPVWTLLQGPNTTQDHMEWMLPQDRILEQSRAARGVCTTAWQPVDKMSQAYLNISSDVQYMVTQWRHFLSNIKTTPGCVHLQCNVNIVLCSIMRAPSSKR